MDSPTPILQNVFIIRMILHSCQDQLQSLCPDGADGDADVDLVRAQAKVSALHLATICSLLVHRYVDVGNCGF